MSWVKFLATGPTPPGEAVDLSVEVEARNGTVSRILIPAGMHWESVKVGSETREYQAKAVQGAGAPELVLELAEPVTLPTVLRVRATNKTHHPRRLSALLEVRQ